jgi:XTP/dITP diphosphohydrolase
VRLVLATANPHKAFEIRAVLVGAGLEVELLARPADLPEVDETGTTLEDNARLKAVALCEATGMPAVADDTGLAVDALGGAPGVHSARYAGDGATDSDNVEKLLAALAGLAPARRTARFTTVALARWPDGREVAAIGDVEGTIAPEVRGAGGFGYDPVFVPDDGDGRTFAQMTAAEKRRVSHRGRAFRTLADGLKVVEALENDQ